MNKQEFRNFIKEVVKHVIRENVEPYDAETDQFGAAPRDRTEPSSGNINIPEYPQSIVRQHDMDGEPRWFVYSSSEPTALILGYGKSSEDAIHNAKTTAGYIKHGGVGHTGEMKEGDEDGTSYGKRDGEFGQDYPDPPEHNYDEQEELVLIKQIKDTSSIWMKTVNPQIYVAYLEAIYRISEKLLKMHGAK